MKLLLDENLSRRMLPGLSVADAGNTHVVLAGLERASDLQVWDYAAAHGFVIATKDDDFSALSALRGHPPRVIKLTLGNSDNDRVLASLVTQRELIEERFADPAVGLVEVAATTT